MRRGGERRGGRPRRAILPALLGSALFGLGACEREPAEVPRESASTHEVAVAVVQRTETAGVQPVAGTVRPFDRAVIAARVMGVVTGADFILGQPIKAGDLLLTIQAEELSARLAQARATLDLATREAQREAQLSTQGASTADTARAAEDRLRVAKAAFAEAETLHSYLRVTAPFNGHITRKLIYTGDFVNAGTPLLEIEARERQRAEVDVPDTLSPLPLGTEVRVISRGVTITGRVEESAAAVHPATRTRRVIIALPKDAPVQSGEFVRALWPASPSEQLTVPEAAVRPFGQIERVYVVRDGRAVLRIVKTGARDGEEVQVLAGLEPGETVVVSPSPTLRDGDPVRLRP